ncbi:hypothetical protein JCM10908_001222 [Rhodotorula pacifica]|uniref:uncharacterized protein n=1 Tax=Rhodotorula pacifica TaxID=1495444 RepID=UPI00316C2EB2
MSKRARRHSPSVSPSPRIANIADLSEEAIDLICAYIRDDPDLDGYHVKRLDYLPDFWEDLADDIIETDYANWLLVLSRFCPSIVSIAVSPFFSHEESKVLSAFRTLASKTSLKSLLFRLDNIESLDVDVCILGVCQRFLAPLSGLECLQLPIIDEGFTLPPSRPPLHLSIKRLILQDIYSPTCPDLLRQYFDFSNVREVICQPSYAVGINLSILKCCPAQVHSLKMSPTSYLACRWTWAEVTGVSLFFPRLTQLSFDHFELDSRALDNLVLHFPLLHTLDLAKSVWNECPSAAHRWLRAFGLLPHLRTLRTGTIRDDGVSLLDDGDDGDWARAWNALDQGYDYERFNRDGIPCHWVFDALGRPIAVPNDLAYRPAVECDTNSSSDEGEDDDRSCASLDFLPPLPDIPRLEDGYEALDDGSDASDSEDCGFGYAEPWRTWSEPCDFEAADAAWMRFDIDDEGKEIGFAACSLGDIGHGRRGA